MSLALDAEAAELSEAIAGQGELSDPVFGIHIGKITYLELEVKKKTTKRFTNV